MAIPGSHGKWLLICRVCVHTAYNACRLTTACINASWWYTVKHSFSAATFRRTC